MMKSFDERFMDTWDMFSDMLDVLLVNANKISKPALIDLGELIKSHIDARINDVIKDRLDKTKFGEVKVKKVAI